MIDIKTVIDGHTMWHEIFREFNFAEFGDLKIGKSKL